jgi:hypothetical protein
MIILLLFNLVGCSLQRRFLFAGRFLGGLGDEFPVGVILGFGQHGALARGARRPNGFFVVRAGGNAGVSYAGTRQATDTDGRAFPA